MEAGRPKKTGVVPLLSFCVRVVAFASEAKGRSTSKNIQEAEAEVRSCMCVRACVLKSTHCLRHASHAMNS